MSVGWFFWWKRMSWVPSSWYESAGTKEKPLATLGAALTKASGAGKGKIFVCEGSYTESVEIKSTVGVYGGFKCADWSYSGTKPKFAGAKPDFVVKIDGASGVTLADLELVSKEFATAVWDNTRTKFILSQDNPELCEKVSKSIGTHQVVEKTVRQQQGALFTSLTTGDASTKLVEVFRLHPNAVKSLSSRGQGYCYCGKDIVPLAFGVLPELQIKAPLVRRDQSPARGLRLEELFLGGSATGTPVGGGLARSGREFG